MIKRIDDRFNDQLRPLSATYGIFPYASGSVLFELGNTKILCAVNLQNNVPPFLRGKNTGWLTAEYALLPASTQQRCSRESNAIKRAGRSIEISRLLSRTLRMAIDSSTLGERSIMVDCDVLQADGGTRTASINGSYLALKQAQRMWIASGIIEKPFLVRELAAFSVGVLGGEVILDPNYHEDSNGDVDINIIMTRDNKIIEMQGGAEKNPLSWQQFDQIKEIAQKGSAQLFNFFDSVSVDEKVITPHTNKTKRSPLFSLKNRQQSI